MSDTSLGPIKRVKRRILHFGVLTILAGAAVLWSDRRRVKKMEAAVWRGQQLARALGPGEHIAPRVYDEDGSYLGWRAWGLTIQVEHEIVEGLAVPNDVSLRGIGFHYQWAKGPNHSLCQALSMTVMGWGGIAPSQGKPPTDDADSKHPGRPSPAEDCQCGFWALNSLVPAANRLYQSYHYSVFGIVRMWGRLQLHTEGVRAEYAMPEVLFIHPDLAPIRELLASKYGCSVYYFDDAQAVWLNDEPSVALLLKSEDEIVEPLERIHGRLGLQYAETAALTRMRGEVPEDPPVYPYF